ncbi:hypothetical protein AB0J38_29140 [Streptomyces sp. NPDC050095]|uniref:hypothetical protein n=1 Tax=unclassified Streptomyces TaxID=2593676 RepID=UPI00341CAC67
MKRLGVVLASVLGLYLIVRGIAEPFVVDWSDPASYRNDWGGPSLFGVLAVHMGPGLASAALMGRALRRRRLNPPTTPRSRSTASRTPSAPRP